MGTEPQTKKQEVLAFDQRPVIYTAADGQEIRLNIDMVKRYLITPAESADKVTVQELVFFLNICKSRGLNPFIKDVYPVKYGSDPLAIITSIDFLRKRAAAELDCEGWDKGVICICPDKQTIRESHGIVLPGETLIGGWFRGYKKGWKNDFYLEVNLSGYIKKTTGGAITRFWSVENQPTMIAKVAEAQGLRTMWPGKFSKMYLAEEMGTPDFEGPMDIPTEIPEAIDMGTFGRFDQLVAERKLGSEDAKFFDEYCKFQAVKNKIDLEELKIMAEKDFDKFMQYFETYKKRIAGEQTKTRKETKVLTEKAPEGKTTEIKSEDKMQPPVGGLFEKATQVL